LQKTKDKFLAFTCLVVGFSAPCFTLLVLDKRMIVEWVLLYGIVPMC